MTNIINREICCDVIIVVTDYKRFQKILTTQAMQPKWLRHKFIAILKMSESEQETLKSWYYDQRLEHAMPEVTMLKAKADLQDKMPALHNMGILAANNPYIYIHFEKDDLPVNIDRAIYEMYYDPEIMACFGRTETFLENGTPLEHFPMVNPKGEFLYDCKKATKLFPSHIDPLATVFRRSLFEKVPYWDVEYQFKEFAYYNFVLRVLNHPNVEVEFVEYTIKKAKRKQHLAGNISSGMLARLIHDIRLWLPEFPESEYKEFQQEILSLLENNEILTFKEIDARIEDYLDRAF